MRTCLINDGVVMEIVLVKTEPLIEELLIILASYSLSGVCTGWSVRLT